MIRVTLTSSPRSLPDGFGTYPTLQGLPRFHRAVPSIALDETHLIELFCILTLRYKIVNIGNALLR